MNAREWIVGALACLPWLHAWAAAADYPPELPAIEQVRSAIDESPEVRAALALGAASAAERRQLIAGPHEWSMQVGYQRRRADETPASRSFNEWDVALERPLRRPDKARLDRELGDQRIAEAAAMAADARHEASKRLLGLWYQWLRERASADVASGQAELSAREYAAIGRRKDLGDASSLEAIQAQAASARAEALARQATDRAQRAELLLREQFPQLAEAPPPLLPTPVPPTESSQALADAFIERDQGVRVARAAAERSRLESQRAAAERRADPTVGVRFASERGAAERMLGVYVSIPFGGEARRAAADAGAARADALDRLVEARLRQMSGEARALESAVGADVQRWRSADESARLQAEAAKRVATGSALGESAVADVLLARRNALEAALAAVGAQVDALENRARLLLGARQLWNFDARDE